MNATAQQISPSRAVTASAQQFVERRLIEAEAIMRDERATRSQRALAARILEQWGV